MQVILCNVFPGYTTLFERKSKKELHCKSKILKSYRCNRQVRTQWRLRRLNLIAEN